MDKELIEPHYLTLIFDFNTNLTLGYHGVFKYYNGSWITSKLLKELNNPTTNTFTFDINLKKKESSESYKLFVKEKFEHNILNQIYERQENLKKSTQHIWESIHLHESPIRYLVDEFSKHIFKENILDYFFRNQNYSTDQSIRQDLLTNYLINKQDKKLINQFSKSFSKNRSDNRLHYVLLDTWRHLKKDHLNNLSIEEIYNSLAYNPPRNNRYAQKTIQIISDLAKQDLIFIKNKSETTLKIFEKFKYDLKVQSKIAAIFGENEEDVYTTTTKKTLTEIKIEQNHNPFFLKAESLGLKKDRFGHIGFYFHSFLLKEISDKKIPSIVSYSTETNKNLSHTYSFITEYGTNLDEINNHLDLKTEKINKLQKTILSSTTIINDLNKLNEIALPSYLDETINKISLFEKMNTTLNSNNVKPVKQNKI